MYGPQAKHLGRAESDVGGLRGESENVDDEDAAEVWEGRNE